MKKINIKEIIIPFVIVLIMIGFAFANNRPRSELTIGPEKSTISLPQGWAISAEDQIDFDLKIEKRAEDGLIRPVIVLIESEAEFENDQEYVDSLIAGAKRTIPSLNLDFEKSEASGFSVWDLSGFYYTGGDKISLVQRLYLKDSQVFALTGSFLEDGETKIQEQVFDIFDQVFESYIKK